MDALRQNRAGKRQRHPALAQPCAKLATQERTDMSNHEQRSHKERKKQPLRTAKEKKAAKQAKKHAGDHQPLIVKKP